MSLSVGVKPLVNISVGKRRLLDCSGIKCIYFQNLGSIIAISFENLFLSFGSKAFEAIFVKKFEFRESRSQLEFFSDFPSYEKSQSHTKNSMDFFKKSLKTNHRNNLLGSGKL